MTANQLIIGLHSQMCAAHQFNKSILMDGSTCTELRRQERICSTEDGTLWLVRFTSAALLQKGLIHKQTSKQTLQSDSTIGRQ
jgi:hypothetical protein